VTDAEQERRPFGLRCSAFDDGHGVDQRRPGGRLAFGGEVGGGQLGAQRIAAAVEWTGD
jgi:hypothetical protein